MDEVELVEYDPRWPALYEEEAARVRSALPPDLVIGVEHFGSTAIPGLVAKPIIDILVAVCSIEEARRVAVAPLEALGNAYWSDNPKRDRMFFVKGLPPAAVRRTHHVHLTEIAGEAWERLAFRDYLRSHVEEARRYYELKRQLADRYRHDREAYTEAKAEYVAEVMVKALARP